ncbi:MAG: nuclear transport factor 2 family protein [Steroidobacteraceae bacterium]
MQALKRRLLGGLIVSASTLGLLSNTATAASASPDKDVQRLLAIHEVQNLMTRYAQDNWNEQFDDLMEYIALDMPDVHINVPSPLVGGAAIRKGYEDRMAKRAAGKSTPGIMHIHANSSPFIEVAGDLKTARGVWDSYGPDIGSGDIPGNVVYSRYAVDFINQNGRWKIWHIQLYPVIGTASDKSLTQGAKERAAAAKASTAPPVMIPTSDGKSIPLWRYDGVSQTPANYPKLPKPYQTFDPKDSY